MSEARNNILARLRANRVTAGAAPMRYSKPLGWDSETRVHSFSERMQAVRGEVHRMPREQWIDWIQSEMPKRGLSRALIGRSEAADAFAAKAGNRFTLRRYERPIDDWKSDLFEDVDFSITGTLAGLAESGSLVLWPNAQEPRLMSLVPPLHIALLYVENLYENFADLLDRQNWAGVGMPTNALLISGPSKTADIEQTLAYGIHGPKALITLLLD